MNKIVAIQPAHLNSVWPSLRSQAATIESPEGLLPEDIFAACKTNAATLFLLFKDEKQVGFVVCRMLGADFHIWWLYGDNGYDVMTDFRDQLMAIARGANAAKITYGSARKGWQKVSAKHGFRMRMVVYETEIDEPKTEIPVANDSTADGGADSDQHATH